MIKMDIEDFIYEVKEELVCYDEIGEKGAENWEQGFRKWLDSPVKKKNVYGTGDKAKFGIEDESEIFDIADEYLEALETGRINEYWKKFQ